MDSSLNLAHRCHRKAEYFLNNHRFREAIESHLRAAHHIQEALLQTTCHLMKASLETQKDFHLSQERVLKQREICEQQKHLIYKQELINRQQLMDKFGLNSPQTTPEVGTAFSEGTSKMANKSNVMTELIHVMSEHDSLLQFLIERRTDSSFQKTGSQTTVTTSELNSPTDSTGSHSDSLYKNGSKMPKDDKTIIEELQTINEKLRQLVFQLFGELELSQKENKELRDENQRLKNENIQHELNTAVPDLPPLEPPPEIQLLY
ncbi:nuclear receptor-binding factor 2-like [Oppia nitens]|uniref:nuclear receptor-binding factor 2-like n=1 Tax=Oppia nitens TaxID=1686743 RepID=UPI0023DC7420|nr:nuclear receptor-binding factor 2-like [Oppia nitens]